MALDPRKTPRQQRSKAMVDLILEAATRVLRRESLAGFNTNRVAEVAGISVGSLYQYFPNKTALVTALIDRAQAAVAAALERLVGELDGRSFEEALAAMAAYAVRQQYGDPVLAAALDHEEKRLPIQGRLQEAELKIVAAVQSLLERHADRLASQLPACAARDCLVIAKALVESDAGRGVIPPADLEARVLRALHGYLTVPSMGCGSGAVATTAHRPRRARAQPREASRRLPS